MPAAKPIVRNIRSSMTLSFIDYLEKNLSDDPPKLRGARTRERLKIAAARALEEKGYHALRVADVTAGAKVAEGSFYVYFKDKTDVALTVLTELLEEFFKLDAKVSAERSPFEAIRQTNRRWLAVCRANAGLMRCILQLGDEEPELSRLSRRTNRIWYERVARSLRRRKSNVGTGAALFALYLVGGMMDELVRKLIIYPDPEFRALLEEMQADDDAIADAASVLWLHIFHPEESPPSDLPTAAAMLAQWMAPCR
jgi:TetR/AcrR family transcriptional repressor of nem operon